MSAPKLTDRVMGWRDILKVHPACELFPPLPPDELKVLGEDIQAHRLQNRIKLLAEKTPDGPRYYVLDGRSRLDAMEAAGLPVQVFVGSTPNRNFFEIVEEYVDPFDYVVSANIYRRHMTSEAKRNVAAELLKRYPDRSNLAIAKLVGLSHPTVADVRTELEQVGDVEKFSTRTDTKGRKQPAHNPRRSASPSSPAPASIPVAAPQRPDAPADDDVRVERRIDDGDRAEASRVLEIARRVRARDTRSEIIDLCDWVIARALPMVAVVQEPHPGERNTPTRSPATENIHENAISEAAGDTDGEADMGAQA
jgi:hypothetical protein